MANQGAVIFNPSGSINSFYNGAALAAGIDAWYGSAIVQSGGFDDAGIFLTPILNGQYVIAYMPAGFGATNFSYWYAILQPTPGGDPIVLGAVYYTGLTAPPYLNYLAFV